MEPLLPIVDPHHHLYVPEWIHHQYPPGSIARPIHSQLTACLVALRWYARDSPEWRASKAAQLSFGGARSGFGQYMVPQLLADMHGNNVTHTVFLECHSFYDMDAPPELQSLRETVTVQQLADQHEARGRPGALNHRREGGTAVCAGIVSSVDLTLGSAVGAVLDKHAAAAPNFRGIRHSCSYADDANIYQASPGKPDVSTPVNMYLPPRSLSLMCVCLCVHVYTYVPRCRCSTTRSFAKGLPALPHVASPSKPGCFTCSCLPSQGWPPTFPSKRSYATT